MKIYFEDSVLFHTSFIPENVDYIVDARMGVAKNTAVLNFIKDRRPNAVVYTNSIFAFSNVYAWNEELKVPEIYIRDKDTREFTRIDRLTDRELRKAHHLANMYIAGVFDSRVKDMECKDEWRQRTSCEDCFHYGICIFHIKDDEWKKCIHFCNKEDVVEVV